MSISTYSEFQALSKSEKLGLVQLEAAKRLMGWVLHSGSVYKLTSFDYAVITAIEDSGTAYTAVTALADVTAGKYYNDRENKILYLRASDSSNPNSRFLAMTFRMFFANAPVIAAHDLSTAFEVEWLPLLRSTSEFGVGLDNYNQLGEAIEGSGTVTFVNDQAFWGPLFDKVYFENQRVFVYSWNRELPVAQAKLIYRGRIETKKWDDKSVQFSLKDFMNELRAPVPLSDMDDVAGAVLPTSLKKAKQRLIYGYVFGHRPTNIDHLVTSRAITGTVAVTLASKTVTGTGTSFLSELSPDDQLFFGNDLTLYTIEDIPSDTELTLTEAYEGGTTSGATANLRPALPKRWMNRTHLIAGHVLAEPATTVTLGISTLFLQVGSVAGLRAGDQIIVGSEVSAIRRISGLNIQLSLSLTTVPTVGTTVKRLSVSNVYLNDRKLTYGTDYTYDADTAQIVLDELAEFNVAPVKTLQGTLTFTNASRDVTATGAAFTKQLKPGDWVKASNQASYFEVLRVVDDNTLKLRTAATYSNTGAAHCKTPEIYDEGKVILSLDCIGATEDGTKTGTLIENGPQIVKDLLTRAGLSASINTASFTTAAGQADHRLGMVIPAKYSDTKVPSLRETISRVNQSTFGSLVQNADFELQYTIFSPRRPSTATQMKELDILEFAVESKSDSIIKTAKVEYLSKEYDPASKGNVVSQVSKTSEAAQYLAKTTKEKIVSTLIVDETQAQIMANRWAFLLEVATSVVKIKTKLQGARLSVNDPVILEHEKLYERIGSSQTRKVSAVQAAKKSAMDSNLTLEDLANAFTRCACIAASGSLSYSQAPESERILNGYITDQYGMMDNDPATYGLNLIW